MAKVTHCLAMDLIDKQSLEAAPLGLRSKAGASS
jgi:hypothetical protein